MSRKPDHVHKFKRHTYKSTGNSVYFCVQPDCNFKIGTEFALGKMCICWRCGTPFQMTAYSIRAAQPHCANCHNKKPSKRVVERRAVPLVAEHIAEHSLDSLQSKLAGLDSGIVNTDDEEL